MNTILLGNLIKIRWIAIFGQLCALFVVTYILNIKIPLYESLTVIVLSVLLNLYSYILEKNLKLSQISKLFCFFF